MEQTTFIPVELVNVSESSRFRGSRLISALLFLLVPLIAGAITIGIVSSVFGEDSLCLKITSCIFPLTLLAGLVFFIVFLIKFFHKNKTISLTIAPEGTTTEFWKDKKYYQHIEYLKELLKKRQSLVEESLTCPAKHTIGFSDVHSVLPKMLAAIFLFISPALITGIPQLLLLGVLPFGWFAYKEVIYRMQPKEYRQAMRNYLCRQWDNAIIMLTQLLERLPDYLPGYELLVHIYTRTGRFEEAMKIAAQLPDGYTDLAHSMQTGIWQFKRIYERCKEPLTDDNNSATNEPIENQETQ
jgi:tetratricopeptide (TPR) repeat protein